MLINSQDEYEAAMRRIQELSGALEDSPEERELAELTQAAQAWDAGVGGEVAGDGKRG